MNKALPRVEQELENLIADWERLHQVDYLLLDLLSDYLPTGALGEDFIIIAPISRPSFWWEGFA